MQQPTDAPAGLRLGAAGPAVPLGERPVRRGAVRDRLPHRPADPASGAVGEASFNYAFGWVRFIHFVAAFVFFFNFVFRIYWGFVGNQFARLGQLPAARPEPLQRQWREAIDVCKVDILQARHAPIESIGHNALAGWTYFMTFLAFLFQCVTGFGLYAAMSTSWLPSMFAWIVPLMGGDFAVRQWHHMAMWFFIVFTMIHVYLVFYHDYVEGRGVISSMAGGWKFVERPTHR